MKEMTMKSGLILTASILAVSALLSSAANGASDAPADKTTANAEVKKTTKPHSHMVDKTGIPASTPDGKQEKPKKPLHDHNKMHK
jgi:hypothetical protein